MQAAIALGISATLTAVTAQVTEQEFADRAVAAVRAAEGRLGIEVETLAAPAVHYLPLGIAGSRDKVAVVFRQAVEGVPVWRGSTCALFEADGDLLAVDSSGLPRLAGFDVEPRVAAGRAAAIAGAAFFAAERVPATFRGDPELGIERDPGTGGPRLCWRVELRFEPPGFQPIGWAYSVDAKSGAVAGREATVHAFDVSGTVVTLATPGTLPDTAANPESARPLAHATVVSSQGTAVTDAAGQFTLVGATPPVQVTVAYQGAFAAVANGAGPDYALQAVLPAATGNALTLNATPTDEVTAQANAFAQIGALRDWTRSVNPLDATADFLATARVNQVLSCGAAFNGSSVQFGLPGFGCVNMAYSTVVLHEMGHWLNVRYGNGNDPDGFGEGNADVYAMFATDQPVVGEDFCGPGCSVRTGENTRPFCGDLNVGCYANPHQNGEVLMGALWKVRERLKLSLGASAGAAAADTLFNAWMLAFDDMKITTLIEEHWLLLDDDDGDLCNGTPNFDAIDGGFRAQGFPGFAGTTGGAAPTTYCTAKAGLACGTPAIGATGVASASASSGFEVFAGPARGARTGLLIYTEDGRGAAPFQGGLLCLAPGPALSRSVPLPSGGTPGACDGEFRIDVNAFASGALGGNPASFLRAPGTLVQCQVWGRDSPATGSFLSDGLEYAPCP